mmetsp:Transcript_13636/g.18903  ORF Transcript_13636/g.18903 Transcript_13636/m.18903 type:complete len:271 (+) Transcript_13636:33-845(+)
MAAPKAAVYKKNEKILALHGPLLYEAKVLKVRNSADGPRYFVHYNGWKKRWDEWIQSDRMRPYNAENLKFQEELKKKASSEEVASSTKGQKGTKRKRGNEEEESYPAVGMKVNLPGELKKRLIDDWENVNRHNKIMQIPVKPSVKEILEYYKEAQESKEKDLTLAKLTENIVDALKIYFEHSLGTLLLYRVERDDYLQEVKEKGINPIEVYGVYHLLRLFVKLPSLVENTGLSEEQKTAIGKEISGLCGYIVKHKTHLFRGEYKVTSRKI